MAAPDIAPTLMPALVAGLRLVGSTKADVCKGMLGVDPGDGLLDVCPGVCVVDTVPEAPSCAVSIFSLDASAAA
jgi:hypothetical protein